MATHTYAIAEEEELESFGRDALRDTSAALQPGEYPEPSALTPPSRGRRFACVLFLGLFLAGGAAGVAFALRGPAGGKQSAGPNNPNAPASLAPEPEAPASTTTTTTTVPPTSAASTAPAAALTPAPVAEVKTYTVQVLESLPHDEMAFTQGLEFRDGFFYEGTGLRGASSVRRVEPKTGKVVQRYDYPEMTLFGEGITLPDDKRIIALTWQSGRGFLFDRETLNRTSEWDYNGEGWGLCTDRARNEVYMSDGTAELRVLDPATEAEKRRVSVTLNNQTVTMLNELEWVCDEVWANVWQTSLVYRIDPASGRVKSIINAGNLPLPDDKYDGMDVLNGIAVDPGSDQLWLTGKKWRKIYRVKTTDSSLDLTKCR